MIRACVIGWPIAHSRSPMIHGYWLRQYGIEGRYEREAVPPEEAATFLRSLAKNGYAGCNVTIPHKETAFALAEERDTSAGAIGAVNTLWVENGRLHGSNTDAYGYMTSLSRAAPDWKEKEGPVCVLGAGGAARAIVHGFIESGVERVRVFARSHGKADALAHHFGPRVQAFDWSEREKGMADASVAVNATSIGLNDPTAPPPLDVHKLRRDCIVSDIVYDPLETRLLADARSLGLVAVDGLGMLLHQAVPGFERWFGVRPEVTRRLYDLVAADIEDKACSSRD